MNNITNFYDNLDLRYPEIAIALQDIDRTNPGIVKFSIPILTPSLNNTEIFTNEIHQNSSSLVNKNKSIVEVDNIIQKNYVEIPVPEELCTICHGIFYVLEEDSILEVKDANTRIDGSLSGSGSVIEGGSFSVSGNVNGIMEFESENVKGQLNVIPKDRYIKKGSKWIVEFIGGDITHPRIVARYLE